MEKENKIMELKKHYDYGYYKIKNGLIYYYDNNKKFERVKIYNK